MSNSYMAKLNHTRETSRMILKFPSAELSSGAFGRHFEKLRQNYGSVAIVNLLGLSSGGKEGEAALSAAYQNHHRYT